MERPEFLVKGENTMVVLTPIKPMTVEAYSDYPPLGRFVITDMRQVIAIGVIKSVVKRSRQTFP